MEMEDIEGCLGGNKREGWIYLHLYFDSLIYTENASLE